MAEETPPGTGSAATSAARAKTTNEARISSLVCLAMLGSDIPSNARLAVKHYTAQRATAESDSMR